MTVAVRNVKIPPPELLEVRASGEPVATLLRTPGHDRELALGLVFALELIESARDVATVTHCGRLGDARRRNTIDVRAAPGFAFALSAVDGGPSRASAEPGALHAATLLDATGAVIAEHHDVDPLNAVDKVIGSWLLQVELRALKARPAVLHVSGGPNASIRARAARAGVSRVHDPLDLAR